MSMTKKITYQNVGLIDKTLRVMLSIVFAMLFFTKTVTGTWGIVLIVLSVTFLLTSFISFCPLYSIFRIHTNKKKKSHGAA
jgi:hypothetical protein